LKHSADSSAKRKPKSSIHRTRDHLTKLFSFQKRKDSAVAQAKRSEKDPGDKSGFRRFINAVFAVFIVAAVVFLGVLTFGVLDSSDTSYVDSMEYPAGGFYFSGTLKDGYFSENGYIRFYSGDSYIGGFTDGRFDGEAVYTGIINEPDNYWQLHGVFQSGRIESGVLYLSDGTKVIFDNQTSGDYDSPLWHYSGGLNARGQNGTGRFTFMDGSVYSGDFMNGLAFGEGMLVDASGNTVYYGGFINGLFDGEGVYYSPDGWIYQGSFRNGIFDGEGLLFIDDTVVSGVWEKGVQVSRND